MSAHALQRNIVVTAPPAMRLVPGKRPSVEDLYPRLFDAILEQRIVPTSRFTEEGLAQEFGVSRSVLRRVLARLADQQVIILRPNLRAQVAAPDTRHMQQVLQARRLMEVTVVHLACAQAKPAQIRQLRELITQQDECTVRRQYGSAIRLSGEFHLHLAKIAGNRPLAQFLNSLVPLTSLFVARHDAQAYSDCAGQAQMAIVEALECADATIAAARMAQHLEHLQHRLGQPDRG